MNDATTTIETNRTEQQCENPDCTNEDGLAACRDPADNLLDLCPSCRSDFPVEVLEKGEQFVDDRGPEDRHTSAENTDLYEDGSFVQCPDCGESVHYPNPTPGIAVHCGSCDTTFSHYCHHNGLQKLLTLNQETVATIYDPDRDERQLVTDGGEEIHAGEVIDSEEDR